MAKTGVTFLRGYSRYNKGETAGFEADQAQALIKAGIAKAAPVKTVATTAASTATDTATTDAQAAAAKALDDKSAELDAKAAALDAREAELAAREEALASGTVTDADGVVQGNAATEEAASDDSAATLPKQGKKG